MLRPQAMEGGSFGVQRRRYIASTVAALGTVLAGAIWALAGTEAEPISIGQPAVDRPVALSRAVRDVSNGASVLVRAADPVTPRMDGGLFELSSAGLRRAGRLRCKQVHASAAGRGLCLALSDDGRYEGIVFDSAYREQRRFPVDGVPDRARVSRDGRYGAYTTFVGGSSEGYFANLHAFKTGTRIVDLRTGRSVLRLDEDLDVTRGGKPYKPADSQYWGVTFGSRGSFYATMAAPLAHYLIKGRIGSKRARIVGRHIECPSLSPDGTRIAYKRRIKFRTAWRLHVLDLRTGADVALAERRSIDDQPEWLGNDHVVYSDDRALFAVRADGRGAVEQLAQHATSPAFIDDTTGSPDGQIRREQP